MSNTVSSGKGVGIYRLNAPTLVDNQEASLGVDINGNLKVSVAVAGSADQSTFTPGTTPQILVGGVYETTPETLTNNTQAAIGLDVNRNVKVTLATLLAGEDLVNNILKVNQVFSYLNITTNTTTTVKSGSGLFYGFTVNNNGFTTAGTITIYDNTAGSGTLIGTWTVPVSPPGTALLATDFFPPQLGLNASFATGLTFVTATTAPAPNITALYR